MYTHRSDRVMDGRPLTDTQRGNLGRLGLTCSRSLRNTMVRRAVMSVRLLLPPPPASYSSSSLGAASGRPVPTGRAMEAGRSSGYTLLLLLPLLGAPSPSLKFNHTQRSRLLPERNRQTPYTLSADSLPGRGRSSLTAHVNR